MRIFCDTASLSDIEEWAQHPWVSGFTTNPTLMRESAVGFASDVTSWAQWAVEAAAGLPISIDGPPEVAELGPNVWRKVVELPDRQDWNVVQLNLTAICHAKQIPQFYIGPRQIISVFAGRIMDTGRGPEGLIAAAKQTGAQVLWASVREPYNIWQAEAYGCDIVTVTPPILRKYLEQRCKPLEVVAEETIQQFDRDREGLW